MLKPVWGQAKGGKGWGRQAEKDGAYVAESLQQAAV